MANTLKQNHWIKAVEKENQLRLTWFLRNEEAINESSTKEESSHKREAERLNELIERKKQMVANNIRFPRRVIADPAPSCISNEPLKGTMKPVTKEITALIYNSGRLPYLKQRIVEKPEDRFYFVETSAAHYGWNMWDHSKNNTEIRIPKIEIVKKSFYRRRAGIEKDPEWYKGPVRSNPTVCNS